MRILITTDFLFFKISFTFARAIFQCFNERINVWYAENNFYLKRQEKKERKKTAK